MPRPSLTPALMLLFASIVLLAACGQKGPLYLPDEPVEISASETP